MKFPRTALVLAVCGLAVASPGRSPVAAADPDPAARVRDLYLDLMKLSLTDLIYESDPGIRERRYLGKDWPGRAFTMIGVQRLENIRYCMERALADGVPGDFIEAGAWRGGATIFMRAVLAAHDVRDRTVWVADSFEGLPPPKPEKYPADEGLDLHEEKILAVSLEEVKRNFERYGLLDEQVRFLKGWFSETLPSAPIERLAVLRADADLYESTTDVLINLYDKVSVGGFVILDDYFLIPACRQAVDDFRRERGITDPIVRVDWNSGYWIKSARPTPKEPG